MTDLILLAAGASRRFGSQKLLADFEGAPLYHRAFAAASQAAKSVQEVRVVVVTRLGLLDQAAREGGFVCSLVPDELPISASIIAGVRAARPGAVLCFFVCDQPLFTAALLARFIEEFRSSGFSLGRVRAGARFGSPSIFAPVFFPQLLALTGDQGGKDIFRGRTRETFFMEVPAQSLQDMDVPWERPGQGGAWQ
jgi:molybdenum cofactor cytidylyltransferase